ncbi:hypothetical protein [Nitrosopumilus sp. b2]|uniref:hypothetical protein n=1 Tax=Nitrosopumilus sp. b2 TaxID=2109908 RepID=UPI0015F3F725|nr:hypothetical protein [Nitrosopumilus sp. b2]KAF6244385.1 hypothetical protein C6989_08895 [Nitrosopumilus sp. b2]
MKFKRDSKSLENTSELRILAEYNRRFKQMKITQKKANRLRDQEMHKESKKFQELVELLLKEIEVYYRKYRTVLIRYGVLPESPLIIDDITKEEKEIANTWQTNHQRKYGV